MQKYARRQNATIVIMMIPHYKICVRTYIWADLQKTDLLTMVTGHGNDENFYRQLFL